MGYNGLSDKETEKLRKVFLDRGEVLLNKKISSRKKALKSNQEISSRQEAGGNNLRETAKGCSILFVVLMILMIALFIAILASPRGVRW